MTKLTKTLTALAAAATLGTRGRGCPATGASAGRRRHRRRQSSADWRSVPLSARPRTGLTTATAPVVTTPLARSYYGGGCYWTRQRVWTDWGWRFGAVRVCG